VTSVPEEEEEERLPRAGVPLRPSSQQETVKVSEGQVVWRGHDDGSQLKARRPPRVVAKEILSESESSQIKKCSQNKRNSLK